MSTKMKLVAKGEGQPLMVTALLAVGPVQGGRVMSFFAAWAIAEASLGRSLGEDLSSGVLEYSEWWKTSERTAWRELRAFREAFGPDADPRELCEQARDLQAVKRGAKQRHAVAALGQLSFG